MGMGLDMLLNAVKGSVLQHATQSGSGFDPTQLLGHLDQLFAQHSQQQSGQNVRPASQDRYGDPAAQGGRSVKPASQDPYGDPADDSRH